MVEVAPRATIEASSPQAHAALAKWAEDYSRKRDPNAIAGYLGFAKGWFGGGGPHNRY